MDTLQSVKDYLASLPLAAKIAGSVCAGVVTIWILKRSKGKRRKEYPQNTVILMQIGRGPYAPSLTPFAVKLETYLRMAKIPYENDHSARRSPKGKVPFIIYDGQPIADSAFCIKFLNKTFDIDLNKGFSEEQIGIAHAWRKMLEENTYWTLVLHRWVYDKERQAAKIFGLAWLTTLILTRFVKNMTYRHGIGRHTEDEVYDIMREDLQNLSQFIGTKKFLLGDKPCEDDCAVFGLLSQLYWHMFENRNASIMEDFPNLCSYCERMKETFWPDWNECITSTGK